jgi:hypothetical protein
MRGLLILSALVFVGMGALSTADAAKRRTASSLQTNSASLNGGGNANRNANSADAARANNLDPARSYGNYPDWARSAFGARGGPSR